MNGDQPAEPRDADNLRETLAFLNAQIQSHERYHTQKENMTWLATIAYLAGAAALVGLQPFWEHWSVHWFIAWMVLLTFTAIAVIWFVQWHFASRHKAAAFFHSCIDIATQWLDSGVEDGDLRAERLDDFGNILVPRRLALRFRERNSAKPSVAQVLTLIVMLLWTLGAFVYVMLTFRGPCGAL